MFLVHTVFMFNIEIFSERLKELLSEAEITPIELAKNFNIWVDKIYSYLRAKYAPKADLLCGLCDYFGCSADYLLGLTETTPDSFQAPVSVTAAITKAINSSKLSKAEIQRRCRVSPSVMEYWLKGKGYPTTDSLVRLAECLDVSVDALLGREK